MRSVVLFWINDTLYTRAGQVWDRDISLTDAALMAGTLSDQGPQHVVIRRGHP